MHNRFAVLIGLSVILTVLTGYATVIATRPVPATVLRPDTRALIVRNLETENVRYVASKRGKKYYLEGSPGALRLSPKYRITFDSAEKAEAAGFRQ